MFESAKYIKLGRAGEWDNLCLADGTMRLGFYEVPHELGINANHQEIRDIFVQLGRDVSVSSNFARQVIDFYTAPDDCLWITFSKGFLWWCRVHGSVEFIGSSEADHPQGSRLRRAVDGWSNKSLKGEELRLSDLSGRLTKSARYQGTICAINGDAFEYLKRKITGEELPLVLKAQSNRNSMIEIAQDLISLLTPQDFELFVEILFSKSGWLRVSVIGETMKDIDLELELPITGERALVQVKTKTNQSEFLEYSEILQAHSADRNFFVYHTAKHDLSNDSLNIKILGPKELAEATIRSGMIDWLIDRV